jgi:hypothetical protein
MAAGFIERYAMAGEQCIQIQNWRRHQHPHPREEASVLPAPIGYPEPDLATAQPRPEPDPATAQPRPGPSGTLTSSSSPSFPSGSVPSGSVPSGRSLREHHPHPPREEGGRPQQVGQETSADAPKTGTAVPGSRANGTNPRANGTNPRAQGTNPRELGTNPRKLGTNPKAAPTADAEPDAGACCPLFGVTGSRHSDICPTRSAV